MAMMFVWPDGKQYCGWPLGDSLVIVRPQQDAWSTGARSTLVTFVGRRGSSTCGEPLADSLVSFVRSKMLVRRGEHRGDDVPWIRREAARGWGRWYSPGRFIRSTGFRDERELHAGDGISCGRTGSSTGGGRWAIR